MTIGDFSPQFFCSGIQGTAGEQSVVIMSFATPIATPDHSATNLVTNVRIAMPIEGVKNMIDFLTRQLAKADQGRVPTHPMPERTQ